MILNALSFDVEDYFHVSAFAMNASEWERWPARVDSNTRRLLELCAEHDAKATFFVLGWVAERYPEMVRQIVSEGHELASHGYWHQRITEQSLEAFRGDVLRTKQLLEDIAGVPVCGYRAPSFSLHSQNRPAYEILQEIGYRYSSSVYPIRHDHYGDSAEIDGVFSVDQKLVEIPMSALRLGQHKLPISGGGYFRLLPYAMFRYGLNEFHTQQAQPAMFYLHPWELDPQQPKIPGVPIKSRVRHYLHLKSTENKLGRLLEEFTWDRIDAVYRHVIPDTTPDPLPRILRKALTSREPDVIVTA